MESAALLSFQTPQNSVLQISVGMLKIREKKLARALHLLPRFCMGSLIQTH